jgi:hypothetical protein
MSLRVDMLLLGGNPAWTVLRVFLKKHVEISVFIPRLPSFACNDEPQCTNF